MDASTPQCSVSQDGFAVAQKASKMNDIQLWPTQPDVDPDSSFVQNRTSTLFGYDGMRRRRMNSSKRTAKDASHFQTAGTLLLAANDWTSVVENFPYGLGALILYYALYQSELIPRWLSVWGLVGATLLLAMGLSRLFSQSETVTLLALPIILNEMTLAVWLIVVGLDSSAIASAVVGVLFIFALVSTILGGVFLRSANDPDYLTVVSANENQVLIGVLFQLTLTASVVGIPILMFPILREHSASLALGYVIARIFEGIADAVMAISRLLLLTLSREFVKAGTLTAITDVNEIE
jgi:hypothetical protein